MHIGNKTTYALFFTAPLKRVVGVRGFGGCEYSGVKGATHSGAKGATWER